MKKNDFENFDFRFWKFSILKISILEIFDFENFDFENFQKFSDFFFKIDFLHEKKNFGRDFFPVNVWLAALL